MKKSLVVEIAEDIVKTRRAIEHIKSIRAHSKTEYKRLVTQGANVVPPGEREAEERKAEPAASLRERLAQPEQEENA